MNGKTGELHGVWRPNSAHGKMFFSKMAQSHTSCFQQVRTRKSLTTTGSFPRKSQWMKYPPLKVSAIEGRFFFEMKGHGRKIIKAPAETCPVHPDSRCMGRLAKHSFVEGNSKSPDVIVFGHNQRSVVLRASRTTHPFEQVVFDYEDPPARSDFNESQSRSSLGNTSSGFSGSQEPRKENNDNFAEVSDAEKWRWKRTLNHNILDFCGIGFIVRDCLKSCYSVSTGTVLRLKCWRNLELGF